MNNTYLGNELAINKAVVVGVDSVEVSNPKFRSSYSVRNVSTSGQVVNIVLSNNDPAVVGVGLQLGVGESFIDSDSEGYKCWSGAIRCIASATAGSVAIMERVED